MHVFGRSVGGYGSVDIRGDVERSVRLFFKLG